MVNHAQRHERHASGGQVRSTPVARYRGTASYGVMPALAPREDELVVDKLTSGVQSTEDPAADHGGQRPKGPAVLPE